VVVWPTRNGRDFVIFSDLRLDNGSIVEISRNEAKHIASMPAAKRSGSASGCRLPTIGNVCDSKSMSNATKGQREMTASHTNGNTAVHLVCKNVNTGLVQECGSAHSDFHGRRADSSDEKKAMSLCADTVRKTVLEMKQRPMSIALCSELSLLEDQETKVLCNSFVTSCKRILEGNSHHWCQSADKLGTELSVADMVLLEWACNTGEMRNHMALHCHEDSNKSHPLESCTLFGRAPNNDNRDATTIRKEMKDGCTAPVQLGLCIRVRCGLDSVHCRLRSTMHAADWSRNAHNWSWVHGPQLL